MQKRERELEQSYLDNVYGMLCDRIAALEEKLDDKKQELVKARSHMWEEGTRAVSDFDDIISLTLQDQEVLTSHQDYVRVEKEKSQLEELKQSAYFGRIDFAEEGEEPEAIYIGKYSFFKRETYDYFVYDWRAPIASMYYEYDTGAASYESPGGTRSGELTKKRQYQIREKEILFLNDTESAVRDEILGKVLSGNTDNTLRVIISSIQREQNKAIRHTAGNHLVIYGPAGSGKTSVGLHRLAYLLYQKRGVLDSKQIVIISNNHIFQEYIGSILPELGEEDASRQVFQELARRFLPGRYRFLDYYEQMNVILTGREEVRIRGIGWKYSTEFLHHLIQGLEQFQFRFHTLRYQDEVVLSRQEFKKRWEGFSGGSFQVRYERVMHIIETRYQEYFADHRADIETQIERDKDTLFTPQDMEIQFQKVLGGHIKRARKRIVRENELDDISIYRRLLSGFLDGKDDEVVRDTFWQLDHNRMSFEDAMVLLCIRLLAGKVRPDTLVQHVLIDEAQDYNLLQLYFLKGYFGNATFTLLADLNQAVDGGRSLHSYQQLKEVFSPEMEELKLDQSYRCSGPINELAFQVLQLNEQDQYRYFHREGERPSLRQCGDSAGVLAAVEELLGSEAVKSGNTAILTATESEALWLFRELEERWKVQVLVDEDDSLRENVVIMPAVFSKGLEFDSVILTGKLESGSILRENANLLYLMCTRALHRLYLVTDTELSGEAIPWIQAVQREIQ